MNVAPGSPGEHGLTALMLPLHDDIARLLGDKVKVRSVVVWYDQRGEFQPLVDELRGAPVSGGEIASVNVAGGPVSLIQFDGSMLQLRSPGPRPPAAGRPTACVRRAGPRRRPWGSRPHRGTRGRPSRSVNRVLGGRRGTIPRTACIYARQYRCRGRRGGHPDGRVCVAPFVLYRPPHEGGTIRVAPIAHARRAPADAPAGGRSRHR